MRDKKTLPFFWTRHDEEGGSVTISQRGVTKLRRIPPPQKKSDAGHANRKLIPLKDAHVAARCPVSLRVTCEWRRCAHHVEGEGANEGASRHQMLWRSPPSTQCMDPSKSHPDPLARDYMPSESKTAPSSKNRLVLKGNQTASGIRHAQESKVFLPMRQT